MANSTHSARQDKTGVQNDSQNDKVGEDKIGSLNDSRDVNDDVNIEVDEDKVESLNDFRDESDDENIDDKLEGFREDFNDNYGDLEEDQGPGKDMKPEPPPPPQPPLYRPSQPSIKLSFLGTNSFALRTGSRCPVQPIFTLGAPPDRSVFRSRDLDKIKELRSHSFYLNETFLSNRGCHPSTPTFTSLLSKQDISEQEKEKKRTFPALGPQTGQH